MEQPRNYRLIPSMKELRFALNTLSRKQLVWFFALFGLLIAGLIGLIVSLDAMFSVRIAGHGGSVTEGVVGSPRFINPVLAISDSDKDATELVYSGLMKQETTGKLELDLADSYTISEDGLTYTFQMREDALFHDKEPVTAEDVVFTINVIKDETVKSPLFANWENVTVSSEGDYTVIFRLQKPYLSFLDQTTLKILPKHIWERVPSEEFSFSQFNTAPIGSGPFEVTKTSKNRSDVIEKITLKSFKHHYDKEPFLRTFVLRFYANEDALIRAFNRGRLDIIGSVSPQTVSEITRDDVAFLHPELSRFFGIFFNQSKNDIFSERQVRQAVSESIDRTEMTREIFLGYATATSRALTSNEVSVEVSKENAQSLLEQNGWSKNSSGVYQKGTNTLSFALATANAPELIQVAEYIEQELEDVGFDVTIQVFDVGNLYRDVIKTREFDALLFGQIIVNDADIFAFWHSSQDEDPGLNITGYTNSRVDTAIEDLLSTNDTNIRAQHIETIEEEIARAIPAVFLYNPDFVYVIDEDIKNIKLGTLPNSVSRFSTITQWFTKTEKIWSIFIKQ